jgi:large subunit ribosomal protein L4
LLINDKERTKAKERAEVAGSTRKIKKTKGTGTARAGSAKNPLFKVVEQFWTKTKKLFIQIE